MSYVELQKMVVSQLQRDFSNFKKTGESRRTANYLSTRLSLLEENLVNSRRYHEEIMCRGKLVKEEMDELAAIYDQIVDIYVEYRCELLDALQKCAPTAKAPESHAPKPQEAAGEKDLRLPRVNIPCFSGSYTKWRAFHDVFVSLVDANDSLSNVQKLHHLKSSLSGEAERLIQHFGLEEDNYEKAWDLLKGRYDHKRILVNAQLKLFFGQATLTQESVSGIKSMLDISQECIHSLENLGVPVRHWDVILIYILFQKMPTTTQQLWEERLGKSKNLPTIKQFEDFLETRFRTLEAVDIQPSTRSNMRFGSKPNTIAKALHAKTQPKEPFECQVCHQGQHSLRKCRRFLNSNMAQKLNLVRQVKVCENCLAYSHTKRDCPSTKNCYFCQQRHNTLLHPTPNPHSTHPQVYSQPVNTTQFTQHNTNVPVGQGQINYEAPAFRPGGEPSGSQARNAFFAAKHGTQVLLATALVKVRAADGRYHELRALIDSGSEATFITESAVQLLKLKRQRGLVKVSGLGLVTSGTSKHYVELKFASRHSTYESATEAHIFKSLSGLLPAQPMILSRDNKIMDLELADPVFHVPATIDLLFGCSVYSDIILPDVVRFPETNSLIAQKTQLGWIILGKVSDGDHRAIRSHIQRVDLDDELRRFWEMEESPFNVPPSKEDAACEEHFEKNTRRLPNGRYEVALPFKKGEQPAMGSSIERARRRFAQLEHRFANNPRLQAEYSRCVNEYLTLQHMEEVDVRDDILRTQFHCFLPHHAVFKETSSTTKLRVVFDAAAKNADGSSLNEHLMVGPKSQTDIIDIIMKWRRYLYTFTADIEKMYRQVLVRPVDRSYQLIFWRQHQQQPLRVYRLNTVTFGTACAPYLAIRTLKKAAKDEALNYPVGASVVENDMYVDDLISGADTLCEALQKQDEVRKLLLTAGFNLRKWTSNEKSLLHNIPEEDCEVKFDIPSRETHVKTLGIQWDPIQDFFSFQSMQHNNNEATKRTMLSAIAKMYDPLGWISPCIILAKVMMQKLWCKGMEWDQPIPPELADEWERFRQELPCIQNVKIPRWIHTHKNCKAIEIHGFCDASTKAYGASVYIRVLDSNDKTHMRLLISKTKVAPLKQVSLPRLELCGAVILASLIDYTTHTLQIPEAKLFAWSDSTITLAWIRAPPTRWTTFVSNRVAEIQRLTNPNMWRHVRTQHNPADLASRGVSPATIASQVLWWEGPSFLRTEWNFVVPEQPTLHEPEEERRAIKTFCTTSRQDESVSTIINKFSRLSKVIRVLAFCQRFVRNCKVDASSRKLGILDPDELQSATQTAIKAVQKDMFPTELEQFEKRSAMPKTLRSLNAFVDGRGILRIGGRLQHTNLPYTQQHPIILKASHHFTELIIADAHKQTHHGSIQQMLAYIRTAYWVLQLKRSVKKHIHNCNVCFRHRGKTMQQLMGSLPAPRVSMARPFSNTGVDYAGPVDIKAWKGRGAKTLKGYFSIFICLATKAIHLELVSDLTTQAFIAAFRRFTARRGLCSQMYSDNGTNFVGANSELNRMLKQAQHDWDKVADVLASQGTRWSFIPPASPHFGGLWETGVKSVKRHLTRTIGNEKLTFEEFNTLLTQIEACLNSRPLCPLSNNPDELNILTPAHFLIGESLKIIPQGDLSEETVSYLQRWNRTQSLVDIFWRRWSQEYLSRLQQRPKWTKAEAVPNVGELVLIKDVRLPPSQWMLARITEIHPGKDNLTRVVTLKTRNGVTKRPINKICHLPSNKASENSAII